MAGRGMADGQANAALRRKIEASRASAASAQQITPPKALSVAFAQAFDARLGLATAITQASEQTLTLPELLETLPEGGLLAVLEGPGDAQGVAVLDGGLIAAIIEMLTTGRISQQPPPPRRSTRTDAALAADLIDAMLRDFGAPFEGSATARWAAGFGYATYLEDPRPLSLMLEDVDYRVLSIGAELDGGKRSVSLTLALPSAGRGDAQPASPGGHGAQPMAADGGLPWAEALEAQVMQGRASLDAVLCRVPLALSRLQSLRPGDTIPLPAHALQEVSLRTCTGRDAMYGRLGQSGGCRAVRLNGASQHDAEPPKAERATPAPAQLAPASPPQSARAAETGYEKTPAAPTAAPDAGPGTTDGPPDGGPNGGPAAAAADAARPDGPPPAPGAMPSLDDLPELPPL